MKKLLILFLGLTLLTACAQTAPTPQPVEPTQQPTAAPTEDVAPPSYPPPSEGDKGYPAPGEVQGLVPYPGPQIQVMPSATRFDVAEVDRVLDAIFVNPDRLDSLVVYTQAPCTSADGLGGPPKCGQGQADGSMVEGLPVLGSEGHFILKGESRLSDLLGSVNLLGVFKVQDGFRGEEYYPAGNFGIVLNQSANGTILVLRLTPDGIVRLDYPAQLPGKDQVDLEMYLNPAQ